MRSSAQGPVEGAELHPRPRAGPAFERQSVRHRWIVRVARQRDRLTRDDGHVVEVRANTVSDTCASSGIDSGRGCGTYIVGPNPEQEADDWAICHAQTLVTSDVEASLLSNGVEQSSQCLNGSGHPGAGVIDGKQIDTHAPQRSSGTGCRHDCRMTGGRHTPTSSATPLTSPVHLTSTCSWPSRHHAVPADSPVDPRGVEPLTSALQRRRSTS